MEDNLLPLPGPSESSESPEPDDVSVLERVDWEGLDRHGRSHDEAFEAAGAALVPPDSSAPRAGRGRVSLAEWLVLVEAELQTSSSTAHVVCRAGLYGPGGAPLPLTTEQLDGLCDAVGRAHRLPAGVAVDEDGSIVGLLPEAVSWSTLAATLSAALVGLAPGVRGTRCTIGLADIELPCSDLEEPVRLSARALAHALETKRPVSLWTPADEVRDARERSIVSKLVESLEKGEGFRLVFQPKYDTRTEVLVGAEGLLRHEGGPFGEIQPSEFLPIAARAGILEQLERWVIEEGVAAISMWRGSSVLGVPISLNIRGVDLMKEPFVDDLRGILERHGVEARFLRIEVSEADILHYRGSAGLRLRELRDLGVSIALDDFGKRGTTVTDLGALPIDVLKVHRSLIADMARDQGAHALVRGVVSLANALGIDTVAAGVETPEQLEMLRELGCGAVQGFLLSRPLELVEFDELLAKRRAPAA